MQIRHVVENFVTSKHVKLLHDNLLLWKAGIQNKILILANVSEFKDVVYNGTLTLQTVIFTARVRSTREGTVFTGVCLFTPAAGTPIWLMGGTPFSDPGREYPLPRSRQGVGTPSQVQMVGTRLDGVPPSKTRWGTPPHPRLDGVPPPPSKTGWGTPPPPSRTGWGNPPSGDRAAQRALATRQAVCLLRSLSCFSCMFFRWTHFLFLLIFGNLSAVITFQVASILH